MVSYIALNLWKSSTFVFINLYTNMLNGFSGWEAFRGLYKPLFNVLNTTFSVGLYLLLDQSISYNSKSRYAEKKKDAKAHTNPNYDPVNSPQKFSLDTLFRSKAYLNEMGISTNEDDSTNNITDSFRYNRDHLLQNIDLSYYLS